MARKPRIHIPGSFYQVILRGNAGQDIFEDVTDTAYFEGLISEGIERFGHRVHAYCWMKNHVHLIIQIADTPLSKIMQNISFRYTRYFNYKYDRTGHVFQGRYKAILVDPQNYLLQLAKYINLNPVKANIVSRPEEYRWGSYRAYVGKCECDWLTTDYILGLFSEDKEQAISGYIQFMSDDAEESQGDGFLNNKGSNILGDDDFIEQVHRTCEVSEGHMMSMEKIISIVCRRFDVKHDDICSSDKGHMLSKIRAIIGYLVTEYTHTPLVEYSRFVNRDVSTISGAVTEYRKKLSVSPTEINQLEDIKTELSIVS